MSPPLPQIPSTEGPLAFAAVLDEAAKFDVPVHRVSQGSGIMLLTDGEIKDFMQLGQENQTEVCLFVGPRNAWDISATARSSAGVNVPGHRGMDQIKFALEDIGRGCDLGLRSILVADSGLLWAVDEAKKAGHLPANLIQKMSVQLGVTNPANALVMQRLGAGTLNPTTDLTVQQLSAIREVVDVPLDVYVEAPDDFGGYVRHFEVPDMVDALGPVYIKLGLRNSPNIYPAGNHLQATCIALSRERVRRARLVLDLLERYSDSKSTMSPRGPASDHGVPFA